MTARRNQSPRRRVEIGKNHWKTEIAWFFFLVHAELECVTVFFGFFGTCKRIKKRVCPSVCSSVDSSVCSTHVWNALWLRIFYVTSKSHLFSSLWKIGWAQRSAQASELVSVVERASEASSAEQANEWTWRASKWPSTYIGILLCYLKPPWSVLSWKTAPVDMEDNLYKKKGSLWLRHYCRHRTVGRNK